MESKTKQDSDNSVAETHELSLPVIVQFQKQEDIVAARKFLATSFFAEVNEQEERANKKKYTETKAPELPTVSSRKSEIKIGETTEEMIARIARELQEESQSLMGEEDEQNCTKCGLFPVDAQFRIDRELGYCQYCAEVLHLGESKEARNFDIGNKAKKDDAAI